MEHMKLADSDRTVTTSFSLDRETIGIIHEVAVAAALRSESAALRLIVRQWAGRAGSSQDDTKTD